MSVVSFSHSEGRGDSHHVKARRQDRCPSLRFSSIIEIADRLFIIIDMCTDHGFYPIQYNLDIIYLRYLNDDEDSKWNSDIMSKQIALPKLKVDLPQSAQSEDPPQIYHLVSFSRAASASRWVSADCFTNGERILAGTPASSNLSNPSSSASSSKMTAGCCSSTYSRKALNSYSTANSQSSIVGLTWSWITL